MLFIWELFVGRVDLGEFVFGVCEEVTGEVGGCGILVVSDGGNGGNGGGGECMV